MPSKRYNSLKNNLAQVHTEFFKLKDNPTGRFTKSEKWQTKAYIIFSHVEIEEYLEHTAEFILNKAITKWSDTKKISRVAAGLLAFYENNEYAESMDEENKNGAPKTLTTILYGARNRHLNNISNNNGINKKAFKKLFLPLGLLEEEFNQPLITMLGTLATQRGDLAHKGLSDKTRNDINPFDANENINQILQQLLEFDKNCKKLI